MHSTSLGSNGYPYRDSISFVNLFFIPELAPTVATYYGNRSAAFMMMGTYDKALEDAQNAIRVDENFLKVSRISYPLGTVDNFFIHLFPA